MKIAFLVSELNGVGGVASVVGVLAKSFLKDNQIFIIGMNNKIDGNDYTYIDIDFDQEPDFSGKLQSYFEKSLKALNRFTNVLNRPVFLPFFDRISFPERKKKILTRIIEENSLDVVIGVAGQNAMFLGAVSKRISCKSFGWQLNSFDAYFHTKGKYFWNKDKLYGYLTKNLTDYIVLNEYDKDCFYKNFGISSQVIYNIKTFESIEKSDLNEKLFMSAGHLWNGKGFDLLIDSFKIFSESIEDWKLNIFGVGPDKEKLQKKVVEYGLEERILFPGNTDSTKREFLLSSVFLLPSRWEGMPMIVLEALEMGVPIISFNITAMEPLVTNGVEGFIVDKFDIVTFANRMIQLAKDEELRFKMGQNAVIKANLFSEIEINKEWISLFKSGRTIR